MARLVPAGLAAKSAEVALGPLADRPGGRGHRARARGADGLAHQPRVHGPDVAAPGPREIAGILAGLPEEMVVDVGRRLGGARTSTSRWAASSSYVPVGTPCRSSPTAPPLDLLQIALFTEDPAALDAVIAELPDERIVGGARRGRARPARPTTPWPCRRAVPGRPGPGILAAAAAGLDEQVRDALIRSRGPQRRLGTARSRRSTTSAADDARSLLDVPAMEDAEVRAGFAACRRRSPGGGAAGGRAREQQERAAQPLSRLRRTYCMIPPWR